MNKPGGTGVTERVAIDDASAVGQARRVAQAYAAGLGFGATALGRVGIVATELANNIVKHAGRGEVLLRGLAEDGRAGIELLALDRGPGMNVPTCLRDGYSTAGSPGTGLGAVRRLSETFDVYSSPDSGSAVMARLWSASGAVRSHSDIGVVCLPKPGEDCCGDDWAVDDGDGTLRLLLADGLGHGPLASTAARAAVNVFRREPRASEPDETMARIHAALRHTRGAAVAIAHIKFARGRLHYAGVGNVTGDVVSPADTKSQRLISHNGTAGLELRKVRMFHYPWPPRASLVMHSDGLLSQWRLQRYPGLLAHSPALIAAVLYRDYRRATDDVTVLVARPRA